MQPHARKIVIPAFGEHDERVLRERDFTQETSVQLLNELLPPDDPQADVNMLARVRQRLEK